MNFYEKLLNIQSALKCGKSQYNDFGKYNYRSCEDIIEAAKPLLKEYGLLLTMNDEIVLIGDRFYVKATATLLDVADEKTHSCVAYAREEESKKGMDGSQVTGASSSYARKYALNGMFAIDDNKDSDTTNRGDTDKGKTDKGNIVKMESLDDAKNYVLGFGKHKGETLSEVWKNDRDYLEYLYGGEKTDPIVKMGIGILLQAVKDSRNARAE